METSEESKNILPFNISFSTLIIFMECERHGFYLKMSGIEPEDIGEDDMFGRFGNLVHYTLDDGLYSDIPTTFEYFKKSYDHEHVNRPILPKLTQKETIELGWKCVINAKNLNLPKNSISEEGFIIKVKIGENKHFNFKGFVDLQIIDDNGDIHVIDYKTPKVYEPEKFMRPNKENSMLDFLEPQLEYDLRGYDKSNCEKYNVQLLGYCWQIWKKKKKIPKTARLYYNKFDVYYVIAPTEKDMIDFENWLIEETNKILKIIEKPFETLSCNHNKCKFCHYRNACQVFEYKQKMTQTDKLSAIRRVFLNNCDEYTKNNDNMNIDVQYYGNYVILPNNIDSYLLNTLINNKFSYLPKNAYVLKMMNKKKGRNVDINTYRVKFMLYNKNIKRYLLPIGFKKELINQIRDFYLILGKNINLNVVDCRLPIKKNEQELKITGVKWRGYQQRVHDWVDTVDCDYNKSFLLEGSVGSGKTLMSADFIRKFNVKTLFIIDSNSLLYQTKKVYEKVLGVKVGIIGDMKFDIDADVIVSNTASLTSKMSSKDPNMVNTIKNLLRSIQCCIVDEYHITIVDKPTRRFSIIYEQLLNVRFMVGMTGTLFRNKKNSVENMNLRAFVDSDNTYTVTTQELKQEGYLLDSYAYFFNYDYNIDDVYEYKEKKIFNDKIFLVNNVNQLPITFNKYDGDIFVKEENLYRYKKLKQQFSIEQRNLFFSKSRNNIMFELLKILKDKPVIIICNSLLHIDFLYEHINKELGLRCQYINGSVPTKKREKYYEQMRNNELKLLIATSSIVAKGLDIPSLYGLINTTGNSSDNTTLQAIGRPIRDNLTDNHCVFIDFNDCSHYFKDHTRDRMKVLSEEGHKVETIDSVKQFEDKIVVNKDKSFSGKDVMDYIRDKETCGLNEMIIHFEDETKLKTIIDRLIREGDVYEYKFHTYKILE